MLALQLVHSPQPLHNPAGFGASDFIELALALAFILLAVTWSPWIQSRAQRLASKTTWSMLLLAGLPVTLRLLLMPHHPMPTPDIYDEFSHLLEADTLRHFRLANPPHLMSRFFETFFVLQHPTYSSIYPPGQGLALALGWTMFGHPWWGVVGSVALFCALCYWMLRAWIAPEWALLGGLLAVFEFGPLNQWMNSYWGGAVPAAAGCLVFGALPRLRARWRTRDAVLLGAGLALHLLTRQYESIFLVLSVLLFFLPALSRSGERRPLARAAATVTLVVMPAIALTLLQNKQVTGSWTTLPEMLSQYQYGVPASLTFQANPIPHRELTPQQQLDYKMQSSFRSGPETMSSYLLRLEYRVRFYRLYFYPPLYIALLAFLITARELRFAWVILALLLFALGVNFFPAFRFHYVAAVTCLFILASVTGLERLSRLRVRVWAAGQDAVRLIVFLCVAQFLFWYGLHVFDDQPFSQALLEYETWDVINHGNPERRILVNSQLASIPGKLLVFVRYWPQHIFQDEWVYNAADIDGSRIVWARDLGPTENEALRRYYPGRTALLLEPDARPPRLTAYPANSPP